NQAWCFQGLINSRVSVIQLIVIGFPNVCRDRSSLRCGTTLNAREIPEGISERVPGKHGFIVKGPFCLWIERPLFIAM
ncbi:MAG: hypothetical protein DRZ90_17180, partial [Spirochaetes bacterium]